MHYRYRDAWNSHATLRQSFVNNFLEIAFDDADATATAAALDSPFPRLVLNCLPY